MLETSNCSRPEENEDSPSLSSNNDASRASTPSISRFDGTPVFLLPHVNARPDLPFPDPLQDMAVKWYLQPDSDRTDVALPRPDGMLDESPSSQDPAVATQPLLHSLGEDSGSIRGPSLASFAESLQLERDQDHSSLLFQARLYQAQVATTRASRLLSIARTARRTLADCIRSKDKQSFLNLYSVLCDAISHSTDGGTDVSNQLRHADAGPAGYPDSFVDALPRVQRDNLLNLLTAARRERDFLANRLTLLTQRQLLALLPRKSSSRSNESIFESSTRSASRMSQGLGYVVDDQTDRIAYLESACPLECLIWVTRDVVHDLHKDVVATEIWARVCAKLVTDQRAGMEKVVPYIVDTWAASAPWPGRHRLEHWINRSLQDGAFILDQSSRQSFKVRVQGRHDADAEEERKAESFFSQAVATLLELLTDTNGASVIPHGAIDFCRTTCSHLASTDLRDAFCSFVLIRWLFNSFVVDAVTTPESLAMATDVYIADQARQRILREIVLRAQKTVYNALKPWKHSVPSSPETLRAVKKIAARFSDHAGSAVPSQPPVADRYDDQWTLRAVCLSEVTVIIDALYPQHRPASVISDMGHPGLHSSSSSLSGFSLFPSPSSSSTTLAYPVIATPDANQEPIFTDPIGMPYSRPGTPEPAWASRIDEDQLQDLRASIEEFSVSGRFPIDQQLAMIRWDPANNRTVTQAMDLHDEFFTACDEYKSSLLASRPLSETMFCEATFKDALLSDGPSYAEEHDPDDSTTYASAWLRTYLNACVRKAEDGGEFVLAHAYLSKLLELERILDSPQAGLFITDVLRKIEFSTRQKADRARLVADYCEKQLKTIAPALKLQKDALEGSAHACSLLRGKMLYTVDVRTTSAYDELKSIAAALRIMGKPKRPLKARVPPPLRHWSAPRMSSTNLHLKTEAQILELLSASANHGGPNKLSDDQAQALAQWLAVNNVQNLCPGEERVQKLCMEVRKAADSLTATTSPLWSSALLTLGRAPATPTQIMRSPGLTSPLTSRFDALRLHTNIGSSRDGLSSTASSHPLSARSSRDWLEIRSPTLTSRSSVPFWSPSASDAISPSSATSVASLHTQSNEAKDHNRKGLVDANVHESRAETRQQIISLLLSEVTANLFNDGSETDVAFWTGLGGDIAMKHCHAVLENESPADLQADDARFDFQGALRTLLSRFRTCCDPVGKLDILVEVDTLLGLRRTSASRLHTSSTHEEPAHQRPMSGKRAAGRSLSEVKVNGFRKLFCSRHTRPAAIFRDLQYIASLDPSITAGHTARSDAVWHASLAIVGLKDEICTIMVETADSIIAYHSNNRGHGARTTASSAAQQQRDSATFPPASHTPPPAAADIAAYSMADAAHLLQITAKEGSAVAQRELATLYLTHPELMAHIVAPLARPGDVFREELEGKWRRDRDPARCDPATMCVAHHWMSLSARGGDALAGEYLRQREEMERLP